jgi:2-methylisoborneol synthase
MSPDRPQGDWTAFLGRLSGPVGLGTSAARISELYNRARGRAPEARPREPDVDPAYAERPWGDGSAPSLYCPVTERINDPLAQDINERLIQWAKECGFAGKKLEQFGKAGFGRLAMLTHADCDDPDRLLLVAQLNAALWAADDFYADDTALGALPAQLPPRLMLVTAALDPMPPAGEFARPLEDALRADPILVAFRSGIKHMARYGTHAQIQRFCYATFTMFVSWTAYAAWRHTGKYPPAWEYLAARQHDSFYVSMCLVDAVSGYELDANVFYEPRIRRAACLAGTAAVLVNDLHSVGKDLLDETPPCNMVLQIAADRGCSI